MTRHEQAKVYIDKQKALGVGKLKVSLLENDEVKLIEVLDKESTGKLTIPSFITSINKNGPLAKCNFTEIYVDNTADRQFDCSCLCRDMESRKIKISFNHPENVSIIRGLFNECRDLTEVDLSDFDTGNVLDMSWMFNECERLEYVDISRLNTKKLINMQGLFSGCWMLQSVDIGELNLSEVKYMGSMFSCCEMLTEANFKHIKTGKVEDLSWMFSDCTNLCKVNLEGIKMESVFDTSSMFVNCISLKEIDLENLNMSNVKSYESMLYGCTDIGLYRLNKFIDTWELKREVVLG